VRRSNSRCSCDAFAVCLDSDCSLSVSIPPSPGETNPRVHEANLPRGARVAVVSSKKIIIHALSHGARRTKRGSRS